MKGFFRPDTLAYYASEESPITFEGFLRASRETPSGFTNLTSANVLGLSLGLKNNNMGTGFMSYLDGSAKGYPMRAFPDPGEMGLYTFPGVEGYQPSTPPTAMKLRNAVFGTDYLQYFG